MRKQAQVLVLCLALVGHWSATAFSGPIHDAAKEGRIPAIRSILKRNPDAIMEKDDVTGWTPLHIAAKCGQLEAVKVLLAKGADINSTSGFLRETPLKMAIMMGYEDISFLLIRSGADITIQNKLKSTCLHSAAIGDCQKVAKYLIGKGLDVNARNKAGYTPLRVAKNGRNKRMVQLLRSLGGSE